MAKQTLASMLGDTDSAPNEEASQIDDLEARAPRTVFTAGKVFDPSEVITPRLTIAQGLSPEVRERKADVGDWVALGHAPAKEVSIVIAGHATNRRFVEQGQQKARCWSPDGIQGVGDPGIACAECPFSKWTDSGRKNEQGKTINIRPACDEIDNFVAFSITHGMPVTFPLKGTGAKAARFLKTLSNGLGMGNFAVKMTTKNMAANGRVWSEPVIELDQDVSREECAAYAAIALGSVQVAGELPTSAG